MPLSTDSHEVGVDILPTAAAHTPALESLWRDLQARADASLFVSWSWIGCWLTTLPPHIVVQVLCAERRGVVVGLGLLVVGPQHGLRLPLGRVAHLNSTGREEFDSITIEHNGLLLDREHAKSTHAAMLRYLCDPRRAWRAVFLPGLTGAQAIAAEVVPAGVVVDAVQRTCPVVALQPVRDRGGDYLGLLGTRRRAHIRRSMRACAERGPLTLTAADSCNASQYFERLLALHAQRSVGLNRPSDFDTPFSRRFHERLIESGLPRGEVQLLRVSAGDTEIGYLYTLVHRGRVSFYQSGFDFTCVDPRFSPGLVTLALAIEHNARLGHACFDFLAGDAHYKRTLATHHESMWWVDLRHDGPLLRTENALRRAAYRCRDWLRERLVAAVTTLGLLLAGTQDYLGGVL